LLSVGYPSRAIRNEQFLYVRNFKPDRWPAGDPEYNYKNCDNSPTKQYLIELDNDHPDYKYYRMAFYFRPDEELYDMTNDPDCVNNLAENQTHAEIKEQIWEQLKGELILQEDPRILGKGEIFDRYPNSGIEQQKDLYGEKFVDPVAAYEKYISEMNEQPE
jgi:hypothetical protein